MPYLKKPLDPQLIYSFFSNNQNKADDGLLSPDRLHGAFTGKFVPYNCYPDFGGIRSLVRLRAEYYKTGFPCVLTSVDQKFSRQLDERTDKIYITVPIVMTSDISPFGTYYLEHDGNRYDLEWLDFSNAECQAVYGVDLDQLHTVQTEPGTPGHNPGILYLALEYNGDNDVDGDLFSYITKGNTTLWVEVGEPGKSQKRKIGTAIKYVDNANQKSFNYVKLSIVDSDRKTILGHKNVDKYVSGSRQAYLRISFTSEIDYPLTLTVNATPIAFNQENLSSKFLDSFQPQITEDKQYFVAQAEAGDFGAAGTHTIPRDTIEHFIPITLTSGTLGRTCLYSIDVSNEGLDPSDRHYKVVNNDVLVFARPYAYSAPAPSEFAYDISYDVTSLDGLINYASGQLYGAVDLRSIIPPNGSYALTLRMNHVLSAEYILRAQNNQALSPSKREVKYGQMNWCTHNLLSGNPYNGVSFNQLSSELKYRVDSGDVFKLNSLLSFLHGARTPLKNAEIHL